MTTACPLEPLLVLGHPGSDVVCTGSLPPWPLLVLGIVLAAVSLWALLRVPMQRGRFAAGLRRKSLLGLLTAVMLVAGWLAALDPVLERHPPQSAPHWAAAVDLSGSMRRDPAQWHETLQGFARQLRAAIAEMPRGIASAATGSLTVLGRNARTLDSDIGLETLAARVESLATAPPQDIDAQGSDIAAGLAAAGRAAERSGRAGAVLLLSDGLENAAVDPVAPAQAPAGGDSAAAVTGLQAAEALARLGLPVHVFPATAPPPEQGLIATHVPGQATIAASVDVRLVLGAAPPGPVADGTDQAPVDTVVRWSSLGGSGETTVQIVPGSATVAQLPLRFDRRGLQRIAVDVEQGGHVQHRDLAVQIGGPVRLAVLGDGAWTAVLPPSAVVVTRLDATQDFDPAAFDGAVLDGVPAASLAPGMLQKLADAVRYRGLGLLLVNGPIRGRTTDPTLLESYEKTPLEPLLPVLSAVRPEEQRRGRRVAIVIDTSGSMSGWPLDTAKQVAASVVDQLGQADRLSVVAFSAQDLALVDDRAMTMQGKQDTLDDLSTLTADGGTDPTSAMDRIGKTLRPPCGVFLISDGGFGAELRQPGCMTTSVAIGTPGNPQMAGLGSLVSVMPGDDPTKIRLAFFNPPPRPRRFEPGSFIPDSLDARGRYAPRPALPLEGNAVMQPRDSADIAMTRPWPVDPLLAYSTDSGTGIVGELTTAVPAAWAQSPGGAKALGEIVARLVSFRDADRYLATVVPAGGTASAGGSVQLTPLAGDGMTVTDLDSIQASLLLGDGSRTSLTLQTDPQAPERLVAQLPVLAPGTDPAGASIEIVELGRDAASDPIHLPVDLGLATAAGGSADIVGTAEAARGGQDAQSLRAIAAAGAGLYDPQPEALAAAQPVLPTERWRLWPILLALMTSCWAASVAVGRLR